MWDIKDYYNPLKTITDVYFNNPTMTAQRRRRKNKPKPQNSIKNYFKSRKNVAKRTVATNTATYTKTRTNTKRLYKRAKPIGGHQYVGGYTWVRKGKKVPRFAKMDPTIYHSKQSGIVKEGTPGEQVGHNFAIMGHKDMELVATQWGGDNTAYSANRDRKYFVNYVKQELDISNASNAMTELKIYSLWVRGDLNSTALTAYNSPLEMWAQGEMDSASSGAGYAIPYASPMQSMKFRKNFKISRCVSRTLAPGEMVKFKTKLFYNKFLSEYDIYQKNTPGEAFDGSVRRWTHWVMITAVGQPVIATNAEEQEGVSTAGVCLHIIETKEFNGRYKADKMEPVVHKTSQLLLGVGEENRLMNVVSGAMEIIEQVTNADIGT